MIVRQNVMNVLATLTKLEDEGGNGDGAQTSVVIFISFLLVSFTLFA